MYIIKKEYRNYNENKLFNKLLKEHNQKQITIADIIGVKKNYISQMANGRSVSKLCAYAFCKALNSNYEIENLFEKI